MNIKFGPHDYEIMKKFDLDVRGIVSWTVEVIM